MKEKKWVKILLQMLIYILLMAVAIVVTVKATEISLLKLSYEQLQVINRPDFDDIVKPLVVFLLGAFVVAAYTIMLILNLLNPSEEKQLREKIKQLEGQLAWKSLAE